MLKKITVEQATTGMFVHQFCGSWVDHPFWSRQLLIANGSVLRKIRDSGIRELIIDLERGVGVDKPEEIASPLPVPDPIPVITDSPAEVQESLQPNPIADNSSCSVAQELDRAQELVARGKRDVIRMFADVRMGKVIEGEGLQLLVSDMSESLKRNAHALLGLVRIKRRDEYTYMHSVAVAALMLALARSYGCDEHTIRVAGMAGLLHDLGKVAMPDHILNKPGKLTDAEFDVMRGHPAAGASLLTALAGMPAEVIDACLHHHEKMDGSGYPGKLSGEHISLMARMAAICDVYDAITSNRPYHLGGDPASSLSRMASWKGHFDTSLFHIFVRTLGIYPIGSLVRLASDRLAIVIEQNPASLLKPRLRVFYSATKRQWLSPETLDLAIDDCDDGIVGREDPVAWGLSGLDRLWAGSVAVG
ncbi:HD-GYP domain-containing protein [Halopseudomonas sp.]|uniref:HD-GYP domain-containing protein n=1 Tax=Halopseudomonas sp. TaxID=2901191 RepID=UPI00356929E1